MKSLLIVVPTLNSYKLLPRLLHSLCEQSWPFWRLLFIDGPSCQAHRQRLDQLCAADSRCGWIPQDLAQPGIFGAMNQGFAAASSTDWLLFWGSDDWASSSTVFDQLASHVGFAISAGTSPDLVVCRGRYFDTVRGSLSRPTLFQDHGFLSSDSYRRCLLFGATPPHQATLIAPAARRLLARYDPNFRLSADLDYFLRLSGHSDLCVQCLDLELVHMSDSGVSGQQTQRRLFEVFCAYRRAFGWRWWFPFVARYIRRIASLVERR